MKCLHAIELVEIAEVRNWDPSEESKILTPLEQTYCAQNKRRSAEHQAARLAAKRALRTIVPEAEWLDIEVRKDESGKPEMLFSGKTAQVLEEMGLTNCLISLTHTKEEALASLILF